MNKKMVYFHVCKVVIKRTKKFTSNCKTEDQTVTKDHFWYIHLPIPLYHPTHLVELKRLPSIICLKCLRILKGK
ncbi:hypothetical protein MKX03_017267, partial [Papaver bracteatum]